MAKYIIGGIAGITILMLTAITVLLLANAFPFFTGSTVQTFLSTKWHPSDLDGSGVYGILPLLWGSLTCTIIAMLFSLPVGFGTAMYLNAVAPWQVREFLKPILEILGSIPSVVYGLFGLTFLVPMAINYLSFTYGQSALIAGITLGVMAIPIVVSITEDALSAVPRELQEASLALGATKWETLTQVVLPSAKSGIWAAVLLSFGRAIGETMTVLMIAGGAAQMAISPLNPVRPMTMAIAAEMGETPKGSEHYHALFAVGAVLFIITLILNLIANKYASKKVTKK